jgi:copper resistance protein C
MVGSARPASIAMKTKRLALAWAAGAALVLAGLASAHAGYVRSEPGAGAVVAAVPTEVVIWFGQDLFRRAGENGIEVLGPDGAAVQAGEAVVDDDDRRRLSVALASGLGPGVYIVDWHSLSADDGDTDAGSFTFTYDPAADITSTPMPAAATPTALPVATAALASTATPAAARGVGCGGALVPALGLVAFGAGLRRRKDQR